MPNMPRQPGDAVLCREGRVKVAGRIVGVWWMDRDHHFYHFAFREGDGPVLTDFFRHDFKAAIPRFLNAETPYAQRS